MAPLFIVIYLSSSATAALIIVIITTAAAAIAIITKVLPAAADSNATIVVSIYVQHQGRYKFHKGYKEEKPISLITNVDCNKCNQCC